MTDQRRVVLMKPDQKLPKLVTMNNCDFSSILYDENRTSDLTDHRTIMALEPEFKLGMVFHDMFNTKMGRNHLAEKVYRKFFPSQSHQEFYGPVLIYDDNGDMTSKTWEAIRSYK